MPRNVIISPLNHIRFIPDGYTAVEKYNTIPFDKAWFSETIRPWETKVGYQQPIQAKDWLDLQIWATTNATSASIMVVDCHLEVFKDVDMVVPNLIPAINVNGNGYKVFKHSENMAFADIPEGYYYVILSVNFDTDGDSTGDTLEQYVSEPIWIKDRHPNTRLIEYGHSTNKDYVIFQQTKQKFRKRIYADIRDFQPKVDRTVFKDQGSRFNQTSASPYRTWKFIGGFTSGIPDYEIDSLNHIFSCDSIIIEGTAYTQIEGSQFEKTVVDDRYKLYQASIEITEKDPGLNAIHSKGGVTIIQNIPNYPFVTADVGIGYAQGNLDYYHSTPQRIIDDTALDAWLSGHNVAAENAGLLGHIEKEGNSIIYVPDPTETYTYGTAVVLYKRLGIKNTTTGVNNLNLEMTLQGGRYVVMVGDLPKNNGVALTQPATFTVDHTTPSAQTVNVDLWHEGQMKVVQCSGTYISGIEKYNNESLPVDLANFALLDSEKLTSFSLYGQLAEARGTLEAFTLKGNTNLTDTGYFYPIQSPPPPGQVFVGPAGWKKLFYIDLRNNKLNSAMVDQWFNSMRQASVTYNTQPPYNNFHVSNGVVTTIGQSPAAPPTGASAIARSVLQSQYQWLIGTD